tara:strand:+ start:56 stop:415 length:360 start_codon:yes stop_codon:yes gene_type:complete
MDILIKVGKAMGITPLKEKSYSQLMKMTKGMDESEVESSGLGKLLRAAKKREDAPKKEAAAKRKITKAEGKTKMMRGGMANKKEHFYVGGGSVTDNAGLRALKNSGPKGMEAYKKITGK